MKKLLLIRHAEAEGDTGTGDFARPLSAKGKKDAEQLAHTLKANAQVPQQIISSAALRTATTAGIITQCLQLPVPQFSPSVYEATEHTLLKTINNFNDKIDYAALVGHNPGIAYLLLSLTGKVRDVPSCTAITVVFEDADSWHEITHDSGLITFYNVPQPAY